MICEIDFENCHWYERELGEHDETETQQLQQLSDVVTYFFSENVPRSKTFLTGGAPKSERDVLKK